MIGQIINLLIKYVVNKITLIQLFYAIPEVIWYGVQSPTEIFKLLAVVKFHSHMHEDMRAIVINKFCYKVLVDKISELFKYPKFTIAEEVM